MNITGYTILTAKSITALEQKVKGQMSKGWVPFGGVVVVNDDGWHYIQAIVRYSDS